MTNALGGYGIFRDELYYLACADRLAFGYVDQPPFSLFILAGMKGLIGDSLFALRLLPAVIGSGVVFLTGLIAGELGGKRFARAAAMLASTVSLIHLAFAGTYSMNIFDKISTYSHRLELRNSVLQRKNIRAQVFSRGCFFMKKLARKRTIPHIPPATQDQIPHNPT